MGIFNLGARGRPYRQFIAALTLFAHFTLLVSPAFAAKGAASREAQLKELRPHFVKMVELINRASNAFNKVGPQGFVDELPEFFLPQEKKYLMKELNRTQHLPLLELKGDKLRVMDGKLALVEWDLLDFAQGRYALPDRTYNYDFSKDVVHNLERWKLESKKAATSYLRLLDQILPQAQASIMWMAILGIAGAIGAVWIYNSFIKKKPADSHDAPEPAQARVWTGGITEGTGSANGGAGTPATTTPTTPPTPPAGSPPGTKTETPPETEKPDEPKKTKKSEEKKPASEKPKADKDETSDKAIYSRYAFKLKDKERPRTNLTAYRIESLIKDLKNRDEAKDYSNEIGEYQTLVDIILKDLNESLNKEIGKQVLELLIIYDDSLLKPEQKSKLQPLYKHFGVSRT